MALAIAAASSLPLALATNAQAKEPKPMVMFVQIADDLRVDPTTQTLRLVHVG